jgi:hypothetical protein
MTVRRGEGRVAFFALLTQIAGGLVRGETRTAIYERYNAQLNMKRRWFCSLIREYSDELEKAVPEDQRLRLRALLRKN